MNKKGQMAQVGTILVLFIGIVVALSLLNGGINENIGTVTQTRTVVNSTQTMPTGTTLLVLNGQAISNVVITNSSNVSAPIVPATNYTIVNYDVTTGTLRAGIRNLSGSPGWGGQSVNISYTYEPLGYATDSGTRAVTQLIAIFAALAIVGVIVWKIYENGLFDLG